MPAIGFGQKVTGGAGASGPIMVTSAANSGAGSLARAISTANHSPGPHEIVIDVQTADRTISQNTADLRITARNLTIRAINGSRIDRNHLLIDCRDADNVILRDLVFTGTGEGQPRDTISIDGQNGRGPTGFWIDHCSFEAYFDLSITSNTKDLDHAPPLLITVSNCRFHDGDPNGGAHKNHGALGIHGFDNKKGRFDQKTNAYATVCNNVFDHVRRRSPRSSHLTVVHAFNNVLLDWGTDDAGAKQQNGMEAGNFGLLVAEANYFSASVVTEAIAVARGDQPGRLTVPAATSATANVYTPTTTVAVSAGDPIDIDKKYRKALGSSAVIPAPSPMTDALRAEVETAAGPTAANQAPVEMMATA